MKYSVGELLTREYSDIERRILQARLIRHTDSWDDEIVFICKDGCYGRRRVDILEIWDIHYLVERVRNAPYIQYLFDQEEKKEEPNYGRIARILIPNKMSIVGQGLASLLHKYKWLYDTETWEGER